MSSIVEMVPVRWLRRSDRSQPAGRVTIECARDWVETRLAVWNKKHTAIIVNKIEAELIQRDKSAKMHSRISEAAIFGAPLDIAAVNAWGAGRTLTTGRGSNQ